MLYVTNGEITDYATARGTISLHPRARGGLRRAAASCSRTTRQLVQAEFEKTLPFDLVAGEVGRRPGDPGVAPRHHDQALLPQQSEVDAENAGQPMSDFPFDKSYGDPQEVRVDARRSLGAVTLQYQVNGGAEQSAAHRPSGRAARSTAAATDYYHVMSGDRHRHVAR